MNAIGAFVLLVFLFALAIALPEIRREIQWRKRDRG